MTRDEMLNDLAYARALAEEGRRAPLIGGAYLTLFGAMLAVAYALHWATLTGAWSVLEPRSVGLIWLAFGIIAAAASITLRGRVRTKPGATSTANRVDRHLWQGVSAGILAVVAATVLRTVITGDPAAPNAIMAVGFGLYGVALYVTAAISEQAWLRWFALLAWLVSGVLWFFIAMPWAYLIAATGCLAVLLVPGLVLMQREPKTIV